MCNVCFDQIWIIALDGTLKRCPICSASQQVKWMEFDAAIHAIRLGGIDDDNERNEHIELSAGSPHSEIGDKGEADAGDDDSPDASDGIYPPAHFGAVQYAHAEGDHRTHTGDFALHGAQ